MDNLLYAIDDTIPPVKQFQGLHLKYTNVFNQLLRLECVFLSIGSTGYVNIATRDLRKALEVVMFLFASHLLVTHENDKDTVNRLTYHIHSLVKPNSETTPRDYGSDLRNFHDNFNKLDVACKEFSTELFCFRGMYCNNPIRRVLGNLHTDLEVSINELKEMENIGRDVAKIRRAFARVEKYLPELARTICDFTELGVPLMRSKQKEFTWRYMNMTTIAIFFAGVTVAFLQYTYEKTTTELAISVNTLLFTSLLFSIASGALNLLVLSWRHSFARSPEAMLRKWQSTFILTSPIACLMISGVLFVVAVCLFVFSSNQDKAGTSNVVVLCAGLLASVVIGFLLRFATEYIILSKKASDKGLSLDDTIRLDDHTGWEPNDGFDTRPFPCPNPGAGNPGLSVQTISVQEAVQEAMQSPPCEAHGTEGTEAGDPTVARVVEEEGGAGGSTRATNLISLGNSNPSSQKPSSSKSSMGHPLEPTGPQVADNVEVPHEEHSSGTSSALPSVTPEAEQRTSGQHIENNDILQGRPEFNQVNDGPLPERSGPGLSSRSIGSSQSDEAEKTQLSHTNIISRVMRRQ